MHRRFIPAFIILCALTVTACGARRGPSASKLASSSPARTALVYARCMRSHGVSNFPDPSDNGVLAYHGSTGSPAFRSAQAACARLEPRKVVPSSGQETPRQQAEDHTQLIRWAKCMRHHGYPEMPDPKIGTPQPTPGYGAPLGWGAAYVLIPQSYDAHSQAFLRTARRCGIDPRSNPHH